MVISGRHSFERLYSLSKTFETGMLGELSQKYFHGIEFFKYFILDLNNFTTFYWCRIFWYFRWSLAVEGRIVDLYIKYRAFRLNLLDPI